MHIAYDELSPARRAVRALIVSWTQSYLHKE